MWGGGAAVRLRRMESSSSPRIEGDYLVVPYGYSLPAICIKTGAEDGLVQVREKLSCGGALLFLLLGPLGVILGRKSAVLEYSISAVIHRRIQRMRAIAVIAFAAGLLAFVALLVWPSLLLFAGFVMAFTTSLVARYGFGRSVDVANIWQGEIFLSGLPKSIVDEVLGKKLT